MAKCAYPPCKVQIESGGDNPPPFCEAHEGQKCVFPPCREAVIPNSGWCQAHNDMVALFDFIHGIRHTEAIQRQAEVQRTQAIMAKAGLSGKGNGNVRLLRP